jgi:hypothetical protein
MRAEQNPNGTFSLYADGDDGYEDGTPLGTYDTIADANAAANVLREIVAADMEENQVSGFEGSFDPPASPYTSAETDWWEGFTGGREYITPEEEWQQFRTRFAPGWRRQAALGDIQQGLQSRYMLERPYMAMPVSATAESGYREPTFMDYLEAPGAKTVGQLRNRAAAAAAAAGLSGQEFASTYTPETEEFNRAAWYRRQLAGQGAQQGIATMLALQRPDIADKPGGAYRGHMASAIRSAMGDVYQSRLATGKTPSDFLSWYLGKTKPTI